MKQRNSRRQDQAQAIQVILAEVRAASHSTAFRLTKITEVYRSCSGKESPGKYWRYIHDGALNTLFRNKPANSKVSQAKAALKQNTVISDILSIDLRDGSQRVHRPGRKGGACRCFFCWP
jgi:hypothetical protein